MLGRKVRCMGLRGSLTSLSVRANWCRVRPGQGTVRGFAVVAFVAQSLRCLRLQVPVGRRPVRVPEREIAGRRPSRC